MNLKPRFPTSVACTWLVTSLLSPCVLGQVSPEEHAKHHPEQAGKSGNGTQSEPKGGAGGMMGGGMMDGMMEKMGEPKPMEMYPRLMDLPDLPMEKRAEIEREAHQRMMAGTKLLADGLDDLSTAAATDDFGTMQSATTTMREGLSQFESGLAAHRAIREGKSPRNVAMQWFKHEMNLVPSTNAELGFRVWGMDLFHTTLMVALVAFSSAMVWMYFYKMRRASALVETLSAVGISGGDSQTVGDGARPLDSQASLPGQSPSTKPEKWSGKLQVAAIFEETPSVKTFRLVESNDGAIPFRFLPGQFLSLTVEPSGKPVKRSYTIASSPTQRDYVEITVKREEQGLVSRFLHDNIKPGEELSIAAPSGYFTFSGNDANSIVLVAGGVGITPMMSVIRYLTDRCWGGEIYLLFCCRTPEEYIFRAELEMLQVRHPRLHVVTTMTRADESQWSGPRGRLTKELMGEVVPDIKSRRVHICGPVSMMDAVKAVLMEMNVPVEQVKTENFGATAKRKLAPTAAPISTSPETELPTVTFCNSTKNGRLSPDKTILELADELGVEIDNSCLSGTCGMCKVKMLEGCVTMECEDALEPEEKAAGIILACQAKSTGDVIIEA